MFCIIIKHFRECLIAKKLTRRISKHMSWMKKLIAEFQFFQENASVVKDRVVQMKDIPKYAGHSINGGILAHM